MKRFFSWLASSPVAQTAGLFLALFVCVVLDSAGYFVAEENWRVYDSYETPVERWIYIILFVCWLALFCTAFLRRGAKRKFLWLGSFCAITAITVLLILQWNAFHDAHMTRKDTFFDWYSKRNWTIFKEHYLRYAFLALLCAAQWLIGRRDRQLKAGLPACESGDSRQALKRKAILAAKVLAGIAIGYVAFRCAAGICVHTDHAYDAYEGAYRYYGFPLPFSLSNPDMNPLARFFTMKFQRVAFNMLFWCSAAWAVLFAPQICRAYRANAARLRKPLLIAAAVLAVLFVLVCVFSEQIGYHWYWGDAKFWEYRRYARKPVFPWWQWVLIYL